MQLEEILKQHLCTGQPGILCNMWEYFSSYSCTNSALISRQGHLATVILLMKLGADPTLLDGEGFTCLHLAAQFGHTAIVAYLVAKGLSPNLQDRNGMTPLMWSAYKVCW